MDLNIFTDGSYIKKKNKIYCGFGVHFPEKQYIDLYGSYTDKPTNNRAELYAIKKALEITEIIQQYNQIKTVTILSDSMYSINSLTKWIHSWEKNQWKTTTNKPVKNKDLLVVIKKSIDHFKGLLNFTYVESSHKPSTDYFKQGNYIADQLAKSGASLSKFK
jgi:ribonuclease HI